MKVKYKVCIVITEINLLNVKKDIHNNIYGAFLRNLINNSHISLTILYTGKPLPEIEYQRYSSISHDVNVDIIFSDHNNNKVVGFNEFINSYNTFKLLGVHDFDIIFFCDNFNCGFHSIQAKRTGFCFKNTALVFILQLPYERAVEENMLWNYYNNMDIQQFTAINYMQRYCSQHCDIIIISQKLLDWTLQNYWILSKDRFVVDNCEDVKISLGKILSSNCKYKGNNINKQIIQYEPSITVILSFYNSGQHLYQALYSLACNDYSNFDVIILNASSTHELSNNIFIEMSKVYTNWQFIQAPYETLGATRNRAAKLAKSKYLLFCDCDNIFMPNMISTLVKSIMNSELDCLTSARYFFYNSDEQNIFKNNDFQLHLDYGPCLEWALFTNCIGDSNMIVKNSVFRDISGFLDDSQMSEDWEFLFRLSLKGYQCDSLPIPLYYYRLHSNSALHKVIKENKRYLFYMQKVLLNLFIKYSSEYTLHPLFTNIVHRMYKQITSIDIGKQLKNRKGIIDVIRKNVKQDLKEI
jgi:glycosyltransferase involved in cell wall biosynthesis